MFSLTHFHINEIHSKTWAQAQNDTEQPNCVLQHVKSKAIKSIAQRLDCLPEIGSLPSIDHRMILVSKIGILAPSMCFKEFENTDLDMNSTTCNMWAEH